MSIRMSYWATGGILTVLGLILGRALLGVLAGLAVTAGGFLVAALAFLFKAALVLLVAWAGLRLLRSIRRRRGDGSTPPAGADADPAS